MEMKLWAAMRVQVRRRVTSAFPGLMHKIGAGSVALADPSGRRPEMPVEKV